jgi:osmotically-inducible protein OsmY
MPSPILRIVASAAAAILCFTVTPALTPSMAELAVIQAPDNSSLNKEHLETAENQTNSHMDRQITAKIRKAIVGDKDLSTYAHNVKVITVNGQVTLKGPVQTEEEKQKIASLAASVVSPDKVLNQLTIK